MNTDHFAKYYTQYPAGVRTSPVSVVGVFQEFKPERNMESGEAVIKRAELEVPETVAVTETDIWVINDNEWQTEAISEPESGLQIIQIFRHIIAHRSNGNGRYV
ncbi:MAG: hypothetical protein JKY95_09930 [Planctomycetaceae bacterium]|nr:hypothetical protein [Planctomycetaceae bacterium]